jgi:hypothetical protein
MTQFFGCTARFDHALANSELGVDELNRSKFLNFHELAFGIGFITGLRTSLPELSNDGLFSGMQSYLSRSVQECCIALKSVMSK